MTADQIMIRLKEHGFSSYKVGGFVRDYLLGHKNSDIDIATSATAEEMLQLFDDMKVKKAGQRFGVLIIDGIEVATFRREQYLIQGKPQVFPVKTFEEDASRRDFTINAMAMDLDGNLLDPFHGVEDLKEKRIRAVGIADTRFEEDPIRIVRGIGLAARLGFEIEEETWLAMKRCTGMLQHIPPERIGKEMQKMCQSACLSTGLHLMEQVGLVSVILPLLEHLPNTEQNPKYHHLNAWMHTLAVIQYIEKLSPLVRTDDLIWAAMFHDAGKGLPGIRAYHLRSQQPSDHGHDEKSVEIAEETLTHWAIHKNTKQRVLLLIRYHMSMPKALTAEELLRFLRFLCQDWAQIDTFRRFLDQLFWLKMADLHGKDPKNIHQDQELLSEMWRRMRVLLHRIPLYREQTSIRAEDFEEEGEELGIRLRYELRQIQEALLQKEDWEDVFLQRKEV